MALEITDGNITDILTKNKIIMVDFHAIWCGPCVVLGPIIDELATDNMDIVVGKVNVDENSNTSSKYGIRGIPTILFFRDGEVVDKTVGVKSKSELQSIIDKIKLSN